MFALAGLFALTALLYAAVGLGGGSTYNALLVLNNVDYVLLPSIALICNTIVVTGGTRRFHAQGLIPWRTVLPLFAFSVPLAWLGGRLNINEHVFVLLLGCALFIAGLTMLLQNAIALPNKSNNTSPSKLLLPSSGAFLGLISGMVGIGGGIFLAPILHLSHWARSQVIAGVCSAFILVNSLAGLLGQLSKLQNNDQLAGLLAHWPLFVAVLLGGQIGSMLGSTRLKASLIRSMTAGLILFVAVRLLWRAFQHIT